MRGLVDPYPSAVLSVLGGSHGATKPQPEGWSAISEAGRWNNPSHLRLRWGFPQRVMQ